MVVPGAAETAERLNAGTTALRPATTYDVYVSSCNAAACVESPHIQVTTKPRQFSNVVVRTGDTWIQIDWDTNGPAAGSGGVEHTTASAFRAIRNNPGSSSYFSPYTSRVDDPNIATHHSVTLTSLARGTTYAFRLWDYPAGASNGVFTPNVFAATDYVFTSGPTVTVTSGVTATVTFTSDPVAYGEVYYAPRGEGWTRKTDGTGHAFTSHSYGPKGPSDINLGKSGQWKSSIPLRRCEVA